MDAIRVVIVLVFVQLACQVHGVPEKYPIKVLTPDRSDQPFDERMRDRSVRNRLDLLDLQHAQIRVPTVKAKERIVIGTEVFRLGSPGGAAIEHAAHRHAINACGGDAKPDDATNENVHDQHHPMAAQKDGFDAEQIDTPDAVLRVSDDGQQPLSPRYLPIIARKPGWRRRRSTYIGSKPVS